MAWWIAELVQFLLLIGTPLLLLRFIRSHGSEYVDELFADSPRAGRAIVHLLDVAYYLIFISYALFFVRLEAPEDITTATQMEEAIGSVAGIMLTLGILHGLNVLLLPLLSGATTGRRNSEQ